MDLDEIRRAHKAGGGQPASSFGELPSPVATSGAASARRRVLVASGVLGVLLAGSLMYSAASGPALDGVIRPQAAGSSASHRDPQPPALAPSGKWVLVLESLSKEHTELSEADGRARQLSTDTRVVQVLDSSSADGLNPGYWALVLMPFDTRSRAARACSEVGREVGGTCYPRHIG